MDASDATGDGLLDRHGLACQRGLIDAKFRGIQKPRGDNVLDIGTIRWMYEFQNYEESHNSKITSSDSIATLIIRYNNGNLPVSNPEVTEVLSRIPAAEKERYVSGGTDAVILFSTVDMENEVAMAMIENFVQEIEWNEPPPGVPVSVTGMGEMFTNLIKEINIGKTRMTVLAFILIFGLLLLIYRNAVKAITPVIPIMMIVGWNGLVMYVLGIGYTRSFRSSDSAKPSTGGKPIPRNSGLAW